jgi:protein-S-isoprenylcysteine O-methyltransferase Ste14
VMFQARIFWIYAMCFAVGFHLFVVFYEERALTHRFGAEYLDYCAKVGRWLPRIRRPEAR